MTLSDKDREKRATDTQAVIDAITAMPEHDAVIATRLHGMIMEIAPDMWPRTWYGMPAYTKDSKIIVWFRSGKKFGERYMTVGFNDAATLDDGNLWPISYAVKDLNDDDETKIAELIRSAVR